MKASDIAKFLIIAADYMRMEDLTNLKLQKLLYYAQGCHLAKYGKPLFSDSFHKWKYGPVVQAVYEEYKIFGSSPLAVPKDLTMDFDKKKTIFLVQILETYGKYTALDLSEMTHNESPWLDANMNEKIPVSSIRDFFKTQKLAV